MKRIFYDQKPQTVTVSDYTYNVINHDIFFFGTDYSPLNINKVLNLIVNNYSDKSDADFNIAFSKYHEFYDAVKGRKNDEEILQEVKNHFEKEFYRKQNLPVHGNRFRFTLTKKSVEKLVSINGIPKDKLIDLFEKPSENLEFEYKTVAKYLTRLFESYTKLPSSEREKILFAERYQMIEQVIKSKSKGLKTVINENTWLHVKPYKILYDVNTGYNYMVGYSSLDQEKDSFKIATFRINRLRNLQEDNSVNPINYKEKSMIEERLEQVSPAYISANAKEIKVKLNQNGQYKINIIVRNRPKIMQIKELENGQAEYTVYCTEFQAKNYFFQFGADAVVVKPESLNAELKSEFQDAANIYNEKSNALI